MTEQDLSALPNEYSVSIIENENRQDSIMLQTKYEQLLYSAEGAQQLGRALINQGEKLEEQQDDSNN